MMNKDIIKTEMYVENNKVNVIRINNKEYISLTYLARYAKVTNSRPLSEFPIKVLEKGIIIELVMNFLNND